MEWLQKFIPKVWIYLTILPLRYYTSVIVIYRIMSCGISNTTISFLNVFYSCLTTNSDIFLLEHSTFKRALFLLYVRTNLKKSLELHSFTKGNPRSYYPLNRIHRLECNKSNGSKSLSFTNLENHLD